MAQVNIGEGLRYFQEKVRVFVGQILGEQPRQGETYKQVAFTGCVLDRAVLSLLYQEMSHLLDISSCLLVAYRHFIFYAGQIM